MDSRGGIHARGVRCGAVVLLCKVAALPAISKSLIPRTHRSSSVQGNASRARAGAGARFITKALQIATRLAIEAWDETPIVVVPRSAGASGSRREGGCQALKAALNPGLPDIRYRYREGAEEGRVDTWESHGAVGQHRGHWKGSEGQGVARIAQGYPVGIVGLSRLGPLADGGCLGDGCEGGGLVG